MLENCEIQYDENGSNMLLTAPLYLDNPENTY